jgi:hypothetical protein
MSQLMMKSCFFSGETLVSHMAALLPSEQTEQ